MLIRVWVIATVTVSSRSDCETIRQDPIVTYELLQGHQSTGERMSERERGAVRERKRE